MHSGFSRLRRCHERIERSLYARAAGYSYNAVKIFHTNDCDVSWRLLPTASSSRDVTGSKGPAPPGVGPRAEVGRGGSCSAPFHSNPLINLPL